MAPSAYDDDTMIGEITRKVVEDHGDILQFHQGDCPDAHVDWLLSIFDFPEGATVCDVGCGVGGVAHRMAKKRPDIKWVLLNRSQEQLDMCPDIGEKIHADMHVLPENIDVIMVNYALGHADIRAFVKACKATKAISVAIYEPMYGGKTTRPDLEEQLQYTFRPLDCILKAFDYANFALVKGAKSPKSESASAEAYGVDLSGLHSMALRLVRFSSTRRFK